MATVVDGDFEWNDEKAVQNKAKHGISFEEAVTAVLDPLAIFIADASDPSEERFHVIGCSTQANILVVVTVDRGRRDRITSARQATRREQRTYLSER